MNTAIMQSLVILFLLSAAVGCGPKRIYSGPARPPQEVARIQSLDSARIVRVDDTEISTATVEVLPGRHSVEFFSDAGPEMGGEPILETTCFGSFEAIAGQTYSYTAQIGRRDGAPGRDDSYRWTIFSADPHFRDENEADVSQLKCKSTCRLSGNRGSSQLSLACTDSDKSSFDTSRSGADAESGDNNGSITLVERILTECDSRGKSDGIGQAMCLSNLIANPIIFRLSNNEVLHYLPSPETRIRRGLREKARKVCAELVTRETLSECLYEFGWTLIP